MASARRRSGYVVENSIGIAAPAEAVFDYVTDVRREPEWNPQLREAEKLTPGPVGAGPGTGSGSAEASARPLSRILRLIAPAAGRR